ncbi:hypothetical protein [Rhodovulum steppense]|uniref:Uncharacterized protein n=1 Tax=Rhodovulum steppense TaxID=540251 RepID=A0A4R1YL83_9RHOB|nr:hypothetical protein [Rhodovulum steppense]TCM77623.1 hypothetical protein EV216_12950 [Rhodovulum steppense]
MTHEEDYRVKNAHERRAIDVPGKTVEEREAERKAEAMIDPKDTRITFTVPKRDLDHYCSAFWDWPRALAADLAIFPRSRAGCLSPGGSQPILPAAPTAGMGGPVAPKSRPVRPPSTPRAREGQT